MKGALSDASSVLYDEVQAALFPDTCYAFESGGTPQAIPTLTYEAYLDEHRRHYRTDNSYIILYGNLDIDRALAFLDERYLTPVEQPSNKPSTSRAAPSRGSSPLAALTTPALRARRSATMLVTWVRPPAPWTRLPKTRARPAATSLDASHDRMRVDGARHPARRALRQQRGPAQARAARRGRGA